MTTGDFYVPERRKKIIIKARYAIGARMRVPKMVKNGIYSF
jgi:hypothetical protein